MLKKLKLKFFCFLLICLNGARAQDARIHIVPLPQKVLSTGSQVTFPVSVNVYIDPEAEINPHYAKEAISEIGFTVHLVRKEKQASLVLKNNKNQPGGPEAYILTVSGTGANGLITVAASAKQGHIYALQTLRQLAERNGNDSVIRIPAATVQDQPHFSWRAFMLDESRHFHGKDVVKKLLDEMVRLKLNMFHWHLVDDPAWRIEIKKYPLLTQVASKGDHTHMTQGITPAKWDSIYQGKPGSFYTQDDIREIVHYAGDRGITVIPEIEVPGHVSASIHAYPWLGASSKIAGKAVHGDLYDVTDPKVERFLHDILEEIIPLFPGKVIHIGGDEANYTHWQNSPAINVFMKSNHIPTYTDLQVWAINRMSRYISSKGYRMIGWNEITGDNVRGEEHIQASQSEKLADGTLVQFWDGDVSLINKAINSGYDVVNSNRFFTYLDYPYEVTPFEKAYSFNPVPDGIAPKDETKILGLGAQMWGEFTPNTERLYFQVFPRLAAYAECGWVNPARKETYQQFRVRFNSLERIWKEKGYLKDQSDKY